VSETEGPPKAEPGGYAPSVAERYSALQKAGGLVVPLITVLVAFLIGGHVVQISGGDPHQAYNEILRGSGLSWFVEVGN
jgi:simple sugar transport system permease protein